MIGKAIALEMLLTLTCRSNPRVMCWSEADLCIDVELSLVFEVLVEILKKCIQGRSFHSHESFWPQRQEHRHPRLSEVSGLDPGYTSVQTS